MPIDFECTLAAAPLPLSHAWEHTVGSGRALLALRADWLEHLRRASLDLGFRHVRFHGMLDDDMGTLVSQNEHLLFCTRCKAATAPSMCGSAEVTAA